MQVSIDQLVAMIVREVVAELTRRGVTVTGASALTVPAPALSGTPAATGPTAEPDLSSYRTPVLTEGHLARLAPGVATILVPRATVLTPGARELIRQKKLSIVHKA